MLVKLHLFDLSIIAFPVEWFFQTEKRKKTFQKIDFNQLIYIILEIGTSWT